MKTTNYEISKKLAKIGFKAETIFCWQVDHINDDINLGCWSVIPNDRMPHFEYILAYDLETILEALPESIEQDARITHLELNKNFIGYTSDTRDNDKLEMNKEKSESLANTAARLLILLIEL